MTSSYILQIFLRVSVQNQIGIAQWVIVDKVVQFRLLRHGHIQCILNPGAVDGNLSPIPEQQLHAAGIHVELAGSFIVLHQMYINNYDSWQGFGQSNRHHLNIERGFLMNKLLSCRYNMDTGWKPGSRMAPLLPLTASPWRTNTATPRHNGQNGTGCCTISLWSMPSLCWVGRLSTTCHLAVTMEEWKID